MAIPPSMFDSLMGGYDSRLDLMNSQRMAAYMQQSSAQAFNAALSQTNNHQPKTANPEPNPVLLLLE